ncbi:MAG TPA: ABC transporter substrate-binding protein [Chloroflexota bacterium]|nr:ABC transporter substrate-binding protein [Chloroflexota bacterium]
MESSDAGHSLPSRVELPHPLAPPPIIAARGGPEDLSENDFADDSPENVVSRPYWTRDYVGLGPFRLTAWEPGSTIEGSAFDGHAPGRPTIDGIEPRITTDRNVVRANLVRGEMQHASGSIG